MEHWNLVQTSQLGAYAVLLVGIIVLPGMDMAFVLGKSLVGGGRAGAAALAGIVAGGVVHNVVATLGVGIVVRSMPWLFGAMLIAGAVYMAWIGWQILRYASATPKVVVEAAPASSHAATFVQGLATCLLNPKAYLFMLAVFPQFVRPEYGSMVVQGALLAALTAVVQTAIYGGVALAGARARTWLGAGGATQSWLARGVGVMLIAGAAWSVWLALQP